MDEGWGRTVHVARTWDGDAIGDDEIARVSLALAGDALSIEVDAPYHDDPPPSAPAGCADGLWEHEVVEVFLLGEGERYLEVELGPHQHYLALLLRGRRRRERVMRPLDYRARIDGARWRGRARVPRDWLPNGLFAMNAYALHGVGAQRRYLAWRPTRGDAPDFHRLECFG